MAWRKRLSPKPSQTNTKAFPWLRKFIRIMRHGPELPKACRRSRKRLRIDAIARSQIPKPESTAEYSVTNAVSCG